MCSEKELTRDEMLVRKSILLLGDENTDCVHPKKLQSNFWNLKDAEARDGFKGMTNIVPFRRLHKHCSPYFRQVYSTDLLLWHIETLSNMFPVNIPDISSSRTYESGEDLNGLDTQIEIHLEWLIRTIFIISLWFFITNSIINQQQPMFSSITNIRLQT